MTVNIRLAEYTDLFAIFQLLRKGQEEVGEKFPQPEVPAALHVILDRIQDRLIWIAYEATDKGQLAVGMMAMRLNTWEGAPSQRYLEATHFYVEPEARSKSLEGGKTVAAGLIEAAKNTSVMVSVAMQQWVPLMLGVNFGDRAELKEVLIERHGFERTGANFIRIPSEDDIPDEVKQPAAEAAE